MLDLSVSAPKLATAWADTTSSMRIGQEVGLLQAVHLQDVDRPREFVAHGLHDDPAVKLVRPRGQANADQRDGRNYAPGDHSAAPPLSPTPGVSSSGGGRIGVRSWDLLFFCTSICETSTAGDAAATGTPPDSAPQMPLNTAI